jgi:hypothetical protein
MTTRQYLEEVENERLDEEARIQEEWDEYEWSMEYGENI